MRVINIAIPFTVGLVAGIALAWLYALEVLA
jgi:capsular polysaccharide biosynthesis protein